MSNSPFVIYCRAVATGLDVIRTFYMNGSNEYDHPKPDQ